MHTIQKNLEQFNQNWGDSIANADENCKREQWVFRYDKISDILYL